MRAQMLDAALKGIGSTAKRAPVVASKEERVQATSSSRVKLDSSTEELASPPPTRKPVAKKAPTSKAVVKGVSVEVLFVLSESLSNDRKNVRQNYVFFVTENSKS